jgi:Uma2 family endonuclease
MTEAIALIQEKTIVKNPVPLPKNKANSTKKNTPLISWEVFERDYLTREDGFKYEWNNGLITKTTAMRPKQWYILTNLEDFIGNLRIQNKTDSRVIHEGDIFLTTGKHKRPDLSVVTTAQIKEARTSNAAIPRLVMEVVSDTDLANDVPTKVKDYFEGGVEMVWYIFHELKTVYIYDSKVNYIISATGSDLCSAESIIEDFVFPAEYLFKE